MSYTCLSPILVKNKRYQGRLGSPAWIYVPCGKCYSCLMRRRQDWLTRIHSEMEDCVSVHFLTLTYSEDKVPLTKDGVPCFNKKHLQDFHKRLRKKYPKANIKYYVMSEYGDTTNRPHYHGIYFNLPSDCFEQLFDLDGSYHYKLSDIWKRGIITVGKISDARVQYVTGYIMTSQLNKYLKDEQRPFVLVSQGIGKASLQSARDFYNNVGRFSVFDSFKHSHVSMPRYFRNIVFNKFEQDKIKRENDLLKEVPYYGSDSYQNVREDRDRKLNKFLVKKNRKK